MSYVVQEWLNLAVRWTHVFAAIMWVGQTYFFTWLDHTFQSDKQVWMVHSGGFYIVDKQKRPELLSQTLHWFKWEAFFTLVSGFLLLILVYYNGGIMVDDSVLKMTAWQAAGLSLALIAAGWLVYDFLWISPLRKHETTGTILSYLLLVGAIVGAVVIARVGVSAGRKTAVPFGPFLALGGVIALLVGPSIVHWYLHTMV